MVRSPEGDMINQVWELLISIDKPGKNYRITSQWEPGWFGDVLLLEDDV